MVIKQFKDYKNLLQNDADNVMTKQRTSETTEKRYFR